MVFLQLHFILGFLNQEIDYHNGWMNKTQQQWVTAFSKLRKSYYLNVPGYIK